MTTTTTPPPKTEAQRAAAACRKTRERLQRLSTKLQDMDELLSRIHADRSGAYHLMLFPPLLRDQQVTTLGRSLRVVKRDAAAGCEQSSAWLVQTAEIRERAERLNSTRPPEKAADYNGPNLLLPMPRLRRRAEPLPTAEELQARIADLTRDALGREEEKRLQTAAKRAEERAAAEAKKRERGRALMAEFLEENPGYFDGAIEAQRSRRR